MDEKRILVQWLNETEHSGDILCYGFALLAVWCIVWRLWIRDRLYDCDVGSLGYTMYEIGPVGTFGIAIFLLIVLILFISSIQAMLIYGTKLLIPLIVFWSIIAAVAVLIFRSIKK